MIRPVVIALFLLAAAAPAAAQQDPRFSQHMFNLLTVNPGYAGSRDAFSSLLTHREQWGRLENGNPVSSVFALHTPLGAGNAGAGLEIYTDNIGPKRSTALQASYAYRIRLGRGKLSFGLRGGIYTYTYDLSRIEYRQAGDPSVGSRELHTVPAPNFDFGLFYYTPTLYAGLSMNHLSGERIGYNDTAFALGVEIVPHTALIVGKAIRISDDIVYRPSILFRTDGRTPADVDLASAIQFASKLWVGFSFRSTDGMVFMTQYDITRNLRAGYSYDVNTGRVGGYLGPAHEVFIGFDLHLRKANVLSPRYF